MNSFKYLIPLLVAPILSIAKTANIKAYGLQISLEPTTTSDGTSVFFSTYDGNSGSPLGLSSNISNGEFKPQSRGSSIFVADYAATDGYKIQEYGTVSLQIPSEDLDSNGVHDWLQKENSVYKNVSGSTTLHWVESGWETGNYSITGTLYRASGATTGTYSFTLSYGGYSFAVNGKFYLSYFEGSLGYENESFTASLETQGSDGASYSLSGTSTYSVNSSNHLILNQTTFTSTEGNVIMKTATLTPDGSTFSGEIELHDGEPDTSWADYTDWYLEIVDTSDEDQDGIPDLVDTSVKSLITEEIQLNGWNYHAWPWVYSVTFDNWFYYSNSSNGLQTVWSNYHKQWYYWNTDIQSWSTAAN